MEYIKKKTIHHCLNHKCKYTWENEIQNDYPCPKCGERWNWTEWGEPITGKQTTLDQWDAREPSYS